MTAFALAALRAKAGGDGSRTRVLKAIHTTFYMFRRSLISEWAGEPSRIPLQSIHVIDSPVAAVAPARASLLSSHSGLAGVGWNASWLIKPRELDLRNLHLFLFDPIFYEANESSSTCEPGFSLQVETFTPPFGKIKITPPFQNARGCLKKQNILGWAASGEGALEGELVGVLKPAAGRETMSNAGGANSERGEDFDEIVCGGLAFNVGTQSQDDLGGRFQANPLDEADDTKLIGTHMVEGSEAATQGVIQTGEYSTALKGKDVGGLLDDADFAPLSRGLLANLTEFLDGKKSTLGTRMEAGCRERGGASEFGWSRVFMAEQPEGDSLGASWADTGKAAEFAGEVVKWSRVVERHVSGCRGGHLRCARCGHHGGRGGHHASPQRECVPHRERDRGAGP